MFRVIATAVVTAILTSAFWIFAYNTGMLLDRRGRQGDAPRETLRSSIRRPGPPVAIAEGVEVGPAGLAIPVAGRESRSS